MKSIENKGQRSPAKAVSRRLERLLYSTIHHRWSRTSSSLRAAGGPVVSQYDGTWYHT